MAQTREYTDVGRELSDLGVERNKRPSFFYKLIGVLCIIIAGQHAYYQRVIDLERKQQLLEAKAYQEQLLAKDVKYEGIIRHMMDRYEREVDTLKARFSRVFYEDK